MNKKINIEKTIDFKKNVSEITAISLEHDLKFLDSVSINGNLIVTGKYKTTLAAEGEEEFSYKIPVEISLTDSLNLDTANVNIDDFSYDVVDGKALLCNIMLIIEGEVINNERNCDGDLTDIKDLDLPKIDNVKNIEILDDEYNEEGKSTDEKIKEEKEAENNREEIILESDEIESEDSGLFNIDSSKETYGTFIVYIVRQNETINTIISKYNTSLEEIEKYNDLKDLSIGKKLIIPLLKNEDK